MSPLHTEVYNFIALIHPIQWTIALLVGATGPAKCQKKTSCIYYRQDWSQSVHRTSFLSRQHDVIASFLFGTWSVQACFLQRDVLKFNCEFIHFILLLHISSEVLIIMSSPGQKRGTCGHVIAILMAT